MVLIDVWNSNTLDEEVTSALEASSVLIHNYFTQDRQIFLSYDLGRTSDRPLTRPPNSYGAEFIRLKEGLAELISERNIRAWHYTRLTDEEVADLRSGGVHPSTKSTLRSRLNARVATGDLSETTAEALYKASPFHSSQHEARSGKFWMVSHPQPVDHNTVLPLLATWGGEVASMWLKDRALLAELGKLGQARVIELTVPLALTRHSYSAAEAIVAAFGRRLGCKPDAHVFDLYVTAPLPPEAILHVHTEDQTTFIDLGRGYPKSYVDPDEGRWRELTGEPR